MKVHNNDVYIDFKDIDFGNDKFFQKFSQLRMRTQLGILKKEYGVLLAIPVFLCRKFQWLFGLLQRRF